MCAEPMDRTLGEIECDDAAALAVFHDEVDREIFDEEFGFVFDRLLIERVQHRMAGAIRCGAGALRDALAVLRRHATERTLVDPAVRSARKRHAVVFEFDHGGGRLFAHELDGILVAEPVGAFDGVVEVIAPVVLAHVAERSRDTALRRDRVATRREYFGDASGREPRLGETERRAQTRTARADHDDVVGVIDELVLGHQNDPVVKAMRSTA